jgi:N-acetylglutamate synthase-like GNAT family acetyltransferase
MSNSITFRDCTTSDFLKAYGELPEFTIRGWVAEKEGIVLGCGGVVMKPMSYTAFLKVDNIEVISKREVYKLIKVGLQRILEMQLPVLYAIRDKELNSSLSLLKKMGFSLVYEVDEQEIWCKV